MVSTEQIPKHPTMPEVVEELKAIGDLGFPIAAISLVGYLKNMILVACMGKLGSLELAGGALAIGFTNITGYSVLSGLAMGMEPICSQGFGSKNFSLVSLTFQRTTLMLLLASLPIGLLWVNLRPLMLLLHQDPDITRVASLYCRVAIPDLLANSLLHPLRIYLRSKGSTWPIMWCTLLATSLHLPITIFLSFTLALGVPGVAVSTFLTNFNIVLFLLCYIFYARTPEEPLFFYVGKPRKELARFETYASIEPNEELITNGPSRKIHEKPLSKPLLITSAPYPLPPLTPTSTTLGQEWGMLLRLAIPSCLSVCLEWWWYEFMTLLAGYLHNPQVALATSAIVIQTTSLMYTLPTTLSSSVSTRVGNELGAGRPEKARLATMVAIRLALVGSVFGLVWTTVGGEAWGKVFTEDSEVLQLTKAVLPIIGLCELANCPQTTSCGVLRGSARPGVGAGINFYSFYLVGTPVAMVLAFVWKLGFVGLCYGLLAAQIACVVSILTVISRTDWEKESLKAKELVGRAHDDDKTMVKCEEGVGC
ncbi:protein DETOXIFICATION 55 [Malania oleifera]|uniref:protein DETOXIFICATION 55 n=1 Tax=Malania oleifera TaxID=397392 RepID=UPI0025AEAA3F|nr:protein DETOXIFICATION 55 [Malania oleifera]